MNVSAKTTTTWRRRKHDDLQLQYTRLDNNLTIKFSTDKE